MTSTVTPADTRSTQPEFNKLSIVGFVLAFFISIAGLIVGIVALAQIRQRGERGKALAVAAIVLSVLQIIGSSIWLVVRLQS